MDLYFFICSPKGDVSSASFLTDVPPDAVFFLVEEEDFGFELREDSDADRPPRFRCLEAPPRNSNIVDFDGSDVGFGCIGFSFCIEIEETSINDDDGLLFIFPKTCTRAALGLPKCLARQVVDNDNDSTRYSDGICIFFIIVIAIDMYIYLYVYVSI